MRVGVVIPGGVDRSGEDFTFPYLRALLERLGRRHDVQVFTLQREPQPARYQVLGVTVHHAGAGGLSHRVAYWRTLALLRAEHRRLPFDLLHAFWLTPPGLIAALARLWIRRPLLVHVAGGELASLPEIDYGGWRTARGRLWLRLALAGATRVTAGSAPMIEALAALGAPAARIPFGVDLTRWPPRAPQARRAGARARLVHVASLNRVKDQETLLRAAKRLSQSGVEFELDLAGFDTLDGAVQRRTVELGLDGRVHFHGYLPPSRVRPLVESADLLVMSSRHEAGPFAMLEAAVAGVPTVGTAVGHVAEWAPEAAVAVPVGDADALAGALARLLADDRRRLVMARRAQARAMAEDADWTTRRYEEVYEELVSGAWRTSRGR